ncbi:hypothetical protein [Methanonatronarchaeum sp. AMET-Sl]|uniref:hypothetical protein n=1 Tax=Methanonatronarchaeum sp. AMET-Sl TaxID=3037654 RepID=UPI00244DF2D5|nr:hypothetical protein [Methanonatronarchaeum sp. AMET-Sl]WGI17671.1 hypothetical protein QEN48_01290 [Methanonatronarchaeum sp. AMET-Sl]
MQYTVKKLKASTQNPLSKAKATLARPKTQVSTHHNNKPPQTFSNNHRPSPREPHSPSRKRKPEQTNPTPTNTNKHQQTPTDRTTETTVVNYPRKQPRYNNSFVVQRD